MTRRRTTENGHVTGQDVARLAGVTQSTVSRALRGDPRVASQTQDRVRKAALSLNYIPHEGARSLSTRSTRRVAMVADLGNPMFARLMKPLHKALEQHGLRMMLFAEDGDGDTASAYDRLLDASIDGAVLTTTRIGSTLPGALERRGVPYVLLNRSMPGEEPRSAVADNYGGARLVAERFVADGHRRIGAVLGSAETSTGREREAGFRDGLADAGIPLPTRHVYREWFDFPTGRHGLTALMSRPDPPTAIFCAGDNSAVGALNTADDLGIAVPGDVSIIGFDDLPVASWTRIALTTVRVPFEEMSAAAVELLVGQLGGERLDGPRVFDTQLVLRGTHGPPPGREG